jgi:hypothetical protein
MLFEHLGNIKPLPSNSGEHKGDLTTESAERELGEGHRNALRAFGITREGLVR